MPVIRVSAEIRRDPLDVFDTLADIGHYGRWLSTSSLYTETADISDDPIRRGTTYIDHTTFTLYGEVVEYERPTLLVFHQATSTPRLDALIRYDLTPTDTGTRLDRTTILTFAGATRLVQPIATRTIATENRRTVAALTSFLEESQGVKKT